MGFVLLATGCGPDGRARDTRAARRADTVVVGSFDFSESRVLGELYATVLEGSGFRVQRALGLSSREEVEPALEQGAIDVLPEYTGTALRFLGGGTSPELSDATTSHQRLQAAFAVRGVTVLSPAAAENKNGIAVTRRTAASLNLTRVSDLGPVAGRFVFGGPPECPERPFCLIGLRSAYGLTFRAFRALDASGPATAAALESGEVDVALMFTTSPWLATKEFVLLQDDRRLQPSDNVVPAVRTTVLDHHGQRLRAALDSVSAHLTTNHLVELNRRVELDHQDLHTVARSWLAEHRLPH
jgi:osmoprotectant transport system substrate-binding protein